MKKHLSRLILGAMLVLPLGCRPATAPVGPPAPGYSSSTDQQLGGTLAGADAFYNKLAADAKAGTFKPSPQETAALNTLQAALGVANPVYLAYHGGTATLAQAQQAIQNVQTAQANAQAILGGSK